MLRILRTLRDREGPLTGAAVALLALGATSCLSPTPPRQAASVRATVRAPARATAAAAEPSLVEMAMTDAVVPVGMPHLLVASVLDTQGDPVAGAPIEWVVVAGSVGGIVAVDDGIALSDRVQKPLRAASSSTASGPYDVQLAGQDVRIEEGQTWCVVASDDVGSTDVLVYCPELPDRLWGEVRVVRTWVDALWDWPLDADSAPGTPHTLATRVVRATDGTPRAGYVVTYEVLSGPPADFPGGLRRVSAVTDDDGVATTTLRQIEAAAGRNDVRVTVGSPPHRDGQPGRVLATHVVRKTWTRP